MNIYMYEYVRVQLEYTAISFLYFRTLKNVYLHVCAEVYPDKPTKNTCILLK